MDQKSSYLGKNIQGEYPYFFNITLNDENFRNNY